MQSLSKHSSALHYIKIRYDTKITFRQAQCDSFLFQNTFSFLIEIN